MPFDFNSAFDLYPHDFRHNKHFNCGLYAAYVKWLNSYLTNRQSCVCYSGALSQPFGLPRGVLERYVLAPLLFNARVNYSCIKLSYFCR